ncbi:hypothetical protein ACE939_01740 [Aquimarina sp. W85]|uniref:hypothetical protein n=1 Tax=Aquimarina rhodophyticola TaxID=3342246 RepID=UPI00366CB96C
MQTSIPKRLFTNVLLLLCSTLCHAQYEPNSLNFGLSVNKNFGLANELGAGARVEYAPNCFTTYLAEFTHQFMILADKEDKQSGYSELAFGVNLILFNWYPTTITAGIGYVGNNESSLDERVDKAFLVLQSGNLNHGAQIKLRALYQFTVPVHIYAEFNIKSLGRRYDTFTIGFNYDFAAR